MLVPNGVAAENFTRVPPAQKLEMRRALGLPADKQIFLYVGRLKLETKDLDTLIRAWAALDPELRQQGHLVIVGDGQDRATLERLAAELQVGDTVRFAGETQTPLDYYRAVGCVHAALARRRAV